MDSVVTGDETWVYHSTSEPKQQLLEWRHPRFPKKEVQSDSVSVPLSWPSNSHCVLGPERGASRLIHALLEPRLMPPHTVRPSKNFVAPLKIKDENS